MINIDFQCNPEDLRKKIDFFWELSGEKIKKIEKYSGTLKGSPVFTVNGKYISRNSKIKPNIVR